MENDSTLPQNGPPKKARIVKPKWIIWSRHWVGYKPTKFGVYKSEQEAIDSCARLNASPSGQWYHYSIEYKK